MTTSKITVVTAFLLAAAVPVGIGWTPSLTAKAQPEQPQFDAEAFRKALQELTDAYPLNQPDTRGLQRLVFSLDAKQVREAISVLDEFNDERTHGILSAAFARFAELVPVDAVTLAAIPARGSASIHALRGAWITWAFADWPAATAWARATKVAFVDDGYLGVFREYVASMASVDGTQAIAHSIELQETHPEMRNRLLDGTLSSWAKHEPEEAIAWMSEHLAGHEERDLMVLGAMQTLAQHDLKRAMEGIALVGNEEILGGFWKEILQNLEWRSPSFEIVADHFETAAAGDTWPEDVLEQAGRSFALHDPTRAVGLMRKIRDPERHSKFGSGILSNTPEHNPTLVLEAADAVSQDIAPNGLGSFLIRWKDRDPGAAAQWVAALPAGKKKELAIQIVPVASP